MLQGTRTVREPPVAQAPHLAMKDRFFDWPFDDLGQFTGDLELKVAGGAKAREVAGPPPKASG